MFPKKVNSKFVWRTGKGWIYMTTKLVPIEVFVGAAENVLPWLYIKAEESSHKDEWLMATEFLRLWIKHQRYLLSNFSVPMQDLELQLAKIQDPEYLELKNFYSKGLDVQQQVGVLV